MKRLPEHLWTLFCIATGIGIWPRFVEPNLVFTKKFTLTLDSLPKNWKPLHILHFSDLHLNRNTKNLFLKKILKKIQALKPDLIVCSGDFLCSPKQSDTKRLSLFLSKLKAPLGCFTVLGNHDFSLPITLNQNGEYAVESKHSADPIRGLKRLFFAKTPKGLTTCSVKSVTPDPKLIDICKQNHITLLDNENKAIAWQGHHLNICGIGDHMSGRCNLNKAFENYDDSHPGIILTHNPDAIPYIKDYPGDIILCGHTHGGQINLPTIWKRIMLLENPQFKRGLFNLGKKKAYVNRGLGSTFPFRLFAPPELALITIKASL